MQMSAGSTIIQVRVAVRSKTVGTGSRRKNTEKERETEVISYESDAGDDGGGVAFVQIARKMK